VDSNLVASENPLGSLEQWVALYRASAATEESAELIVPTLPGTEAAEGDSEPEPEVQDTVSPTNPLTYLLLPIALLLLALIINSLRRGKAKKLTRETKEGS